MSERSPDLLGELLPTVLKEHISTRPEELVFQECSEALVLRYQVCTAPLVSECGVVHIQFVSFLGPMEVGVVAPMPAVIQCDDRMTTAHLT